MFLTKGESSRQRKRRRSVLAIADNLHKAGIVGFVGLFFSATSRAGKFTILFNLGTALRTAFPKPAWLAPLFYFDHSIPRLKTTKPAQPELSAISAEYHRPLRAHSFFGRLTRAPRPC